MVEIMHRLNASTGCIWEETESGYFETGCGNSFIVNDGLPSENKMDFCCFCGKHLSEKPLGSEIDIENL